MPDPPFGALVALAREVLTPERWAANAVRAGALQLFLLAAGGATALGDPDIFRAHIRRLGFLDRTAVLDDDDALQQRMESRFAELRASRPPPLAPPTREELLARLPTGP